MTSDCPICSKKGQQSSLITYRLDLQGTTLTLCESSQCSYPIDMGPLASFVSDPHPSSSKQTPPKSPQKTSKRPHRESSLYKQLENFKKTRSTCSTDSGVFQSSSSPMSSVVFVPAKNSPQEVKNLSGVDKIHVFWCQMDGKSWIDAFCDIFAHVEDLRCLIMKDPLMLRRLKREDCIDGKCLKIFFSLVEDVNLRLKLTNFVRKMMHQVDSLGKFEFFGAHPWDFLGKLSSVVDVLVNHEQFQCFLQQILKSKKKLCECLHVEEGERNFFYFWKNLVNQSKKLSLNCTFEFTRATLCISCRKMDTCSSTKPFIEVDGPAKIEDGRLEWKSICGDCGGDVAGEIKLDRLAGIFLIYSKFGYTSLNMNEVLHLDCGLYSAVAVVGRNAKSGFPLLWLRGDGRWMPSVWPEVSLSSHVFDVPELSDSSVRFVVYERIGEREGRQPKEGDCKIDLLRRVRGR